ncbi:hypothetical protein CR513_04028, partial [Mucuna pruriens]
MCLAEGTEPFFYLYDTLHSKLGIKLPFTHFERGVLQALNVAPTQLHPNSWAFVRAFELLCEDLGKAPSLAIDRVGWTSLSNRAKRKLLRLFLESYKTFKNRFFRVVPSDPNSKLLNDRAGWPFFPLQWTRQPAVSTTVDLENLDSWERSFITELKEMPVLHSVEIIKGTGLSSDCGLPFAVFLIFDQDLEEKKGAGLTASFPTVGVEVEAAPLSAAGLTDLPQASQEETSRTPSVFELEKTAPPSLLQADQVRKETDDQPSKRPHLEEITQIDHKDFSAGRDVSMPLPSDPRPLFYKSFIRAADQTLASSSLGQDVESLGLVRTYAALQQYAAHGFALARATEREFGCLEAERTSWAEQSKKSEEENRKLSSALFEAKTKLNDYKLFTEKL